MSALMNWVYIKFVGIAICMGLIAHDVIAQTSERVELETTEIRGHTELPKYLYVVPWQDRKTNRKLDQKLVLHHLYGDLFDPVLPNYIPEDQYPLIPERGKK